MSKAVAALVIGGLGVGAVILIASTSKAATKSPPALPFQFGQGTTVQGTEGWIWLVAPVLNPGPVAPGATVQAVFVAQAPPDEGNLQPPGTLVLMFAQQGSDKSSRTILPVKPAGATGNEDAISAARSFFGV